MCLYIYICVCVCGPGSSVGTATDYGLEGPGSNSVGDEIFRPSRPALGPNQPPVKWLPGLSRGKVRPGRAADHSPASSAAVLEEQSYTSTHPLGHTGPVKESLYLCFIYTCIYSALYIYIYVYICVYVCVCIYIYREREREKERGTE